MSGYLANFALYTMAMIGFIVIAVFIYKKSMSFGDVCENKNFLKIENMLRLSPSKSIYVIKAGKERFLIAADPAKTTMLSKLSEDNVYEEETTN